MVGALFLAARAATFPEILDRDRYPLGNAVAMTTNQSALVAGFAAGGIAVAFLGVRFSLLADAATFGASALIIRTWVRARPVPAAPPSAAGPPAATRRARRGRHAKPGPASGVAAGLRLVFASPALRTPMLFGWLCAFYELPEGVAAPLGKEVGGGTVTVGLIAGLVILAVSGVFGCYQIATNASFVQATPAAQRSQAFGIAQGGISLAQGTAILVAGAAAQHASPASVIAVAGAAGAFCAVALTLSTSRAQRRHPAHRALTPSLRR